MVGDHRAGADRRQHERQDDTVGVVHLAVIPDDAAGHAVRRDRRVQSETLVARDEAAGRQMLRAVRQVVAVAREHEVVEPERGSHDQPVAG